jgi:hypothetical protein
MAKLTTQSTNNTSFDGVTFKATVNQLIRAFGQPTVFDNTGENKTNFEWDMETESGEVFCIYDWKQYEVLGWDKAYEWHIGARSKSTAQTAKQEILKKL